VRFQARLLDAVGQAVIATDTQWTVIYWNRAAEELYGWSAEEATGRSLMELTPSEEMLDRAEETLSELRAGRSWSGEFTVRRKDGTTFPANITDTPMHDEEGNLVAIIRVSTDVTDLEKVEDLRRSEQRFRSLVRYATDIITLLNADGTVRYISPANERVTGYCIEERIGTNAFEAVHPEDRERALGLFAEILKKPGVHPPIAFRVPHADGTWRYMEHVVNNLLDDPSVNGIVINSRDITERKEAEERLRNTEERYRTLVERIPAVTYVQQANASNAVTFVSPQVKDLLGYTPEERTSDPEHWLKVLHPDDRDRVLAEVERTNRTGEPFEMEYRQFAADGRVVWVRDEATLVRSETGEALYWLGVETDMTAHKATEAALKESEERYRSQSRELALLHRVRTALAHELDAPSVLYKAVEVVAEAYGYTQVSAYLLEDDELVLQHQVGYHQILERIPLSQGVSGRAVRTGRPVLVEDVSADPDFLGAIEGVTSEICVPLLDGGKALGFLNVESTGGVKLTRDDLRLMIAVGEHTGVAVSRALLHERVRNSEKRYRALTQNSSDLVTLVGATGVVRYQSPAIERMLGYSPEELLGKNGFDFVHPDDLHRVEVAFAEGLKHPERLQSVEYRFRHKDGSWRWLETVGTNLLEDPAVGCYVLNSRDVTGRKEAEGVQARLAAIVESTDHAVMSMTLEGIVDSWNPGAEKLFGYPAEEMVGRHISVVIPPERRGEVWEAIEKIKRGESVEHRETVRVTKEGRRIDVSLGISPIYGAAGEVVGASAIVRDITERMEAEMALQETEQRYRTLVERIPVVTFIDRAGGLGEPLYVSPQVETMLGYTPQEWTAGRLWRERLHPDDRARILASDERFEAYGEPVNEEYRLYARDGSVVWVREETVLMRDKGGEPLYVQGIMSDITEQNEAETALKESEQRFRRSFDDAAVGMALVGIDGHWLRVNRSLCEIVGYPEEKLVGKTFQSITHPADLEEDLDYVRRLLAGEMRTYQMEKRYLHKQGHVVWVLLSVSLVHDEGGLPLYFVAQMQDVTGRKRMEEQLRRQALHDPLTGLPNRKLFVDRLGHALERTRRRSGRKAAVLFMDLDGFKVVNDSLGHEAGDLLLVVVTERLRRCVRPEDMLARFGGDEFVVLLEDVGDPSEAIRVAGRITEELSKPFVLDGRGLFTSASIGIALGDARTKTPEDLLRDADTAMYRAKDEHADYRVFDLTMYERAMRRLETENDLRRAMEAEEFVVHYQPIIDLATGEAWGVEALLRWNHPEHGLLDPDEFVPIAEESGLVVPMGEAMMEEACQRARKWKEEHPHIPPFVLSVNLSARQLVRPDLVETVEGVLRRTGFEMSRLSLDITETVYVRDLEGNTASLDRLRESGVTISIDDFGTGYSSLAYLKHLPAEVLKLDRSFVRELGLEAKDTTIARTIVDLAHTMGMEVIAEGVEIEEQAVLLREMGCDMAQGYYFSKPLPPEQMAAFLAG
jgi:diguanylate cyclase (GGDEF)-like protein/PAS domain S-box-containing protein